MSCRRAYDIDLADFLAEPRAERFAEFRDHYPRCAACSAEVRAWTEVDGLLHPAGDAHPEPEILLRYADDVLAPAERSGLAAHLEQCAACRDELTALTGFEPARAGAAQPTRARPSLLDSLRRLLFHPGFAYALLLLVAAPTLYDLVAPGGPASSLAPEPEDFAWQREAGERTLSDEVPADNRLERLPARSEKKEYRAAEPAPLQERAEAPAAKAVAAPKRKAAPSPAAAAPATAFADADLAEEGAEADEPASSDTVAEAGASALRSRAGQLELRQDELRALGYVVAGSSLAFEPRPGGGGRVRVPLLQGHGESRVRLISPDERRSLEEVVPDGVADVALEVPPAWHEPGAWRVERSTGALTDVFWVTVLPARP
ncbi:MAG: zf-HC2 domain-containing protein [Deltaproteobacteria bacterium]|nr:zf-HC2 domain-containing protein [Deltaproteobacteria bacterium]